MNITLFLTEHCNRNCTYCDVQRIDKPRTSDIDTLGATCELINDFIHPESVTITGGEPGVLAPIFFSTVFDKFPESNVSVNTNGTLLKRGLHKTFGFKSILYHPFQEINDDFDEFDDERITYHFPVHEGNVRDVPAFVQKNDHITWDFSIYDNKAGKPGLVPSDDTLKAFGQVMSMQKNITDWTRRAMVRLANNIKSRSRATEACVRTAWAPVFDLVNMRIQPCVCSHSRAPGVPLTKESLFKLGKGEAFETIRSELCETCVFPMMMFDEMSKEILKHAKNS